MLDTIKQSPDTGASKAEQTRQHILSEALFLATSRSLNDVTIGELAKASGLSKSGLYAHFGSKENLQVSIVNYAAELFAEKVIREVSAQMEPVARITALAYRWINWYEGCGTKCLFMGATVEFSDKPGPVQDALFRQIKRWISYLENIAEQAISDKSFRSDSNCQQFVYELYSLFLGSQKYHWMGKESSDRELFTTGFNRLIKHYSH